MIRIAAALTLGLLSQAALAEDAPTKAGKIAPVKPEADVPVVPALPAPPTDAAPFTVTDFGCSLRLSLLSSLAEKSAKEPGRAPEKVSKDLQISADALRARSFFNGRMSTAELPDRSEEAKTVLAGLLTGGQAQLSQETIACVKFAAEKESEVLSSLKTKAAPPASSGANPAVGKAKTKGR